MGRKVKEEQRRKEGESGHHAIPYWPPVTTHSRIAASHLRNQYEAKNNKNNNNNNNT